MTDEDKGRREELEKLVEERVENLRQDLEEKNREIKKVRKEVEQLKSQSNSLATNNTSSNKSFSRREFLKKAGLGTAGLAALMSPVSALDIRSNEFNVFTDNGSTQYFSVGENGPVNIQNTNLNLNNNDIKNIGKINVNTLGAEDIGNGGSPLSVSDEFEFDLVDGNLKIIEDYAGTDIQKSVQLTKAVSDTPTTIHNLGDNDAFQHVIVVGYDGVDRFVDRVSRLAAAITSETFVEQNSPSPRSYSTDFGRLDLSFGSPTDSYDILVSGLGGDL